MQAEHALARTQPSGLVHSPGRLLVTTEEDEMVDETCAGGVRAHGRGGRRGEQGETSIVEALLAEPALAAQAGGDQGGGGGFHGGDDVVGVVGCCGGFRGGRLLERRGEEG